MLQALGDFYITSNKYDKLWHLIEYLYKIIQKTYFFSAKIMAYIFEAKYYLYHKDEKERADYYYNQAIELAKHIAEEYFVLAIIKERKNDFKNKAKLIEYQKG